MLRTREILDGRQLAGRRLGFTVRLADGLYGTRPRRLWLLTERGQRHTRNYALEPPLGTDL
jgi:hypothetical protein